LSENVRHDAQLAILYDLRLIFTNSEKNQYTADEIIELIDQTASTIKQQA